MNNQILIQVELTVLLAIICVPHIFLYASPMSQWKLFTHQAGLETGYTTATRIGCNSSNAIGLMEHCVFDGTIGAHGGRLNRFERCD